MTMRITKNTTLFITRDVSRPDGRPGHYKVWKDLGDFYANPHGWWPMMNKFVLIYGESARIFAEDFCDVFMSSGRNEGPVGVKVSTTRLDESEYENEVLKRG